MLGEEYVHISAEVPQYGVRHFGREHDLEAFFGNVPAHDAFRIRIEDGLRRENLGAERFNVVTGDDCRGGAIAEQESGNQVRHGDIPALERERTQLDRQERGGLIRITADIIGGAGDAGGTRDTAEAEDGNALDIGRETHAIDEAGIEGRSRDAGNGSDKDGAQVARLDSGAHKRAAQSLLADFETDFDPYVIRFAPRLHVLVKLDGTRQEPTVHLHAFVETIQNVRIGQAITKVVLQRRGQDFLG